MASYPLETACYLTNKTLTGTVEFPLEDSPVDHRLIVHKSDVSSVISTNQELLVNQLFYFYIF